jgi:hypothetical protein
MPDVSQPVPLSFIFQTIGAIFVVVGIGIMIVRRVKKRSEQV